LADPEIAADPDPAADGREGPHLILAITLLAAGVNHGNTKLWTAMWPGGVINADPDYVDKDGAIHMRFGWWRGVSGRLSIQSRRLDASAPLLG
jgi:hypothetical protein